MRIGEFATNRTMSFDRLVAFIRTGFAAATAKAALDLLAAYPLRSLRAQG